MEELKLNSRKLRDKMGKRRSVRSFSQQDIPEEVIRNCISIAASAPSGANMQPWTFVLVSDPEKKQEIRRQAEEVERDFYKRKISDEWREELKPLKTDFNKPFLAEAPYLICIFRQKYGVDQTGKRVTHYYTHESVGIATGFLVSALHQLGLASLTYTPAPMNFLNEVLNRPVNESPFLILAVGYQAEDYQPPEITKKEEEDYLIKI